MAGRSANRTSASPIAVMPLRSPSLPAPFTSWATTVPTATTLATGASCATRTSSARRWSASGPRAASSGASMSKGTGGVQQATIQWYPGPMAQAMRKLVERLRGVDVVIEVVDARLPRASSNPALDGLAAHKRRRLVLCGEDLADPHVTREWLAWYAAHDRNAIAVNAKDQGTVKRVTLALDALAVEAGTTRAMVV